jgi:hypothetical protein
MKRQEPSIATSNKTNPLPGRSIPTHNTGVPNMLEISSSMTMLNWIHGYTSHLWPTVTLQLVLVEGKFRPSAWTSMFLLLRYMPSHQAAAAGNNLHCLLQIKAYIGQFCNQITYGV